MVANAQSWPAVRRRHHHAGDPASVAPAVEGLEVATYAFAPYVLPITVALLTGLFAIQFKGTSGIGVVFGPLLIVWFVTISALGLVEIAREPAIWRHSIPPMVPPSCCARGRARPS